MLSDVYLSVFTSEMMRHMSHILNPRCSLEDRFLFYLAWFCRSLSSYSAHGINSRALGEEKVVSWCSRKFYMNLELNVKQVVKFRLLLVLI